MPTYGLTDAGFVLKPLDVILAEVEAEMKAAPAIGAEINVSATSVLGQFNGVLAPVAAELWEVAQAIYHSQDVDRNTGDAQDSVAAITGTIREAATKSRVSCTVNLNAGANIAIGAAQASVDGNSNARFTNTTVMANPGGSAANFTVVFEATVTGPVVANAGTLTVRDNSPTGWNSITNPADAVLGTEIETNSALRIRREQEIRQQGGSVIAAIASDLLTVDDVIDVVMLENDSDYTDSDGLPPHSFEAIVDGGTDAAVAASIWGNKPAGIQPYGEETEVVEGEDGEDHDVSFTRPTDRNVYIDVDVIVNAEDYPGDGDAQIKTAVAALGTSIFGIGDDVILTRFYNAVFSVSGVLDVPAIRLGFSVDPTGTANLDVATRERARFDTARIVVDSTP